MKPRENNLEFTPKAKISVVEATPTLSPEQFDMVTKNTDAIVFIVYATGTSPEILNNIIKQKIEENVPVFLVSKNPGDNHGIIKIIYDGQIIKDKFSYKEGEKMPVPDWENPVEVEKQKDLYRKTLKRMNLSEKEIEEELVRWEKGKKE